MENEKAIDEKTYTNWREKIPALQEISNYLESSYTDLTAFRDQYDTIQKANDNAFDIEINDEKKDPDLIRSSIIKEGVDIVTGAMIFPEWNVLPIVTNGAEAISLASMASAALDWMIIECGFEESYKDSQEPMALHGDSYRRPFKKKIADGKYFPQYEECDGRDVLLDTNSVELWSKTIGKRSSFAGKIKIYSTSQIKMRFGSEILKYIQPGAHIDNKMYSEKTSNTTGKDEKFYEVIDLQDISSPIELILVGQNWLPISGLGKFEGIKETPKEVEMAGGVWKNEYPHKDEFGSPILTIHNCGFYVDRSKIRNNGLGVRLYRFQKADEALHQELEESRYQQ